MTIFQPIFFFGLGLWGPYKDAIFPGFYLTEGGQSTTGHLLDYIVKNHPAYKDALEKAAKLYVIFVNCRFK